MSSIFKVKKKFDLRTLIISVLIPLIIGFLIAFLTPDQGAIYGSLNLPSFAPPGYVFAPVWTILYILMGISAYRILMVGKTGINVKLQIYVYALQLALNFLWSFLFFTWQLRGLALIEIIFLLVFVLLTMALFNNRDKLSAKLLIPYLLWIIYASVLNFSVWNLN